MGIAELIFESAFYLVMFVVFVGCVCLIGHCLLWVTAKIMRTELTYSPGEDLPMGCFFVYLLVSIAIAVVLLGAIPFAIGYFSR